MHHGICGHVHQFHGLMQEQAMIVLFSRHQPRGKASHIHADDVLVIPDTRKARSGKTVPRFPDA